MGKAGKAGKTRKNLKLNVLILVLSLGKTPGLSLLITKVTSSKIIMDHK